MPAQSLVSRTFPGISTLGKDLGTGRNISTIAEIIVNTEPNRQLVLFKQERTGRVAHTGVVHIAALTRLRVLQEFEIHPLRSLKICGRLGTELKDYTEK